MERFSLKVLGLIPDVRSIPGDILEQDGPPTFPLLITSGIPGLSEVTISDLGDKHLLR